MVRSCNGPNGIWKLHMNAIILIKKRTVLIPIKHHSVFYTNNGTFYAVAYKKIKEAFTHTQQHFIILKINLAMILFRLRVLLLLIIYATYFVLFLLLICFWNAHSDIYWRNVWYFNTVFSTFFFFISFFSRSSSSWWINIGLFELYIKVVLD